jgi:hypothetical protein
VYVVVTVGFTVVVPERFVEVNVPGVIAIDVAFVTVQESVDTPFAATRVGFAVNAEIAGTAADFVVATAVLEFAETLPTLSRAATAYVYPVEPARPVSVNVVELVVPTCAVGVHVPVHRKILYPASPDPPLSVEEVQESAAVEAVVELTVRPCGTVGAVASTVTVAVDVVDPLALVAVRV